MDKIFIQRLKVETIIGIHGWEQRLPRVLYFDLELGTDAKRAAAKDQIKDAIDYAAVSDAVKTLAESTRYELIETLAEAVARKLLTDFGLSWLKLTLSKPGAVPQAQTVGLTIERRREDYK